MLKADDNVRTPKYDFFKIRLTKIRRISKYEYVQPKYDSPKVKYTHIWLVPMIESRRTKNYKT